MIRRAFTLIEVLVVVTIIATLCGLLLTGLTILKRQQARATTLALLQSVTGAVSSYLQAYPRFGADAPDAQVRPWYYLSIVPARTTHGAYLTLPADRLTTSTGVPADAATADNIRDGFGEPLRWIITDEGAGLRRFTSAITIVSDGASPGTDGDIGFRYSKADGGWVRIDG